MSNKKKTNKCSLKDKIGSDFEIKKIKEKELELRKEFFRVQKKMSIVIGFIFLLFVICLIIFFGLKDEDYTIYDVFGNGEYKAISKLNHLEIIDGNKKTLVKYKDIYTDKIKYNKESSDLIDGNIYLVFSDSSGDKCYEYVYNPSTKETKKDEYDCKSKITESYVVKKPVIYIYPEKKKNVIIKFEHPEYLTTTYPKYENGWFIKANKDGSLYDINDKYYYALYYEEENKQDISFDEGFYVERDKAYQFLEEKLSLIGLNDKERNEMIMYWLPVLENNKKSLVYFELTEERQNTNKLLIEPIPDSLLRVSMHVKKVPDKVEIINQKLIGFNRLGYTVVEWGGVIHN